jgi:hypothetical protein
VRQGLEKGTEDRVTRVRGRRKDDGRQGTDHVRQGAENGRQGTEKKRNRGVRLGQRPGGKEQRL